MPSKFEPGGIVQHEFFVASTPVIARMTGGLKDSVIEYDSKTKKGSGFNYYHHSVEDFKSAVDRAFNLFQDKNNYSKLRKNAFDATIDVSDVARAWNEEFHKFFGKVILINFLKIMRKHK